jgi:hypothetical protein
MLRMPKGCIDVTAQHRGTIFSLVGVGGSVATATERRAYHEAGHTYAALVYGIPIIEVSINPPHLHRGRYHPPSQTLGIEVMSTMSLAGGEAERLFFPGSDGGDEKDLQMVREYLKPRGALRMLSKIDRFRTAARRLVSSPGARQRIEVIAAALLRHGVLSGDAVIGLLDRQR